MDTMKIKPVHKTRLLWICNAIKLNLESDGGAAPKVKKIKPKTADPELPTDPHNAAAKKKVKKAATKKKPDKKGAAGKPSAAEARKAYAASQKKVGVGSARAERLARAAAGNTGNSSPQTATAPPPFASFFFFFLSLSRPLPRRGLRPPRRTCRRHRRIRTWSQW